MPEEIEAGALVEIVKAVDPTMSRDRLRRWHSQGLLPRPRQVGAGQSVGSRSYYPAEAVEQAKTIAILLKQRRDIAWVGWKLWLMDYPVAETYWRPKLENGALLWDTITPILRNLFDDDDAQLAEVMDGLLHYRTTDPMFTAIRKAVGPERFEPAMASLFEMASGYDVGPGHDPTSEEYRQAVDLVDLVLGLRRARTDSLPGGVTLLRNDPQSIVGDYLPVLADLGRVFTRQPWVTFLHEISASELEDAKREIVNILACIALMDCVLGAVFGPGAFGLGRAASIRDFHSNGDQPLLIVGWAIWRREPGVKESAALIKSALEASGMTQVPNLERINIAMPSGDTPGIKLKRTCRVYPHQEWMNSRDNS